MKLLLTAALLFSLATPALAADSKKISKDEEGINKTAQDFFAVWGKNDVKTMASFWAEDATLINPMGRTAHGKAEVEKLFADEQSTAFKGTTAKVTDLKLTRTLAAGLDLVDAEMTVDGAHGPDGAAMPQMKFHVAAVMQKKGDHWLFLEARPYAFLPPPPQPAKTN